MVDTNVDAVLMRPLTEKEQEVQEEIERRFFQLLSQRHWEGVEGVLASYEDRSIEP